MEKKMENLMETRVRLHRGWTFLVQGTLSTICLRTKKMKIFFLVRLHLGISIRNGIYYLLKSQEK